MAERKKAKQTKGLKPTSVARVMKQGSGIPNCRVAKKAVASTIDYVEGLLKSLGRHCSEVLGMMNKKKVTRAVLLEALKRDSRLSCQKGLKSVINHADGSVSGRKEMALKASLRVFGRGIEIKKSLHSISIDAKHAIGELAIQLVMNLSRSAGRYVTINKSAKSKSKDGKKVGGHNTIKSKHVQAAKAALEGTQD